MDSLYIKFDDYSKVNHPKVTIGDVASVYSSNKNICNRVKTYKLCTLDTNEHSRMVISSLYALKIIENNHKDLTINLLGATDFLVAYDYKKPRSKFLSLLNVALVSLILFFGAGFSIMAFNNDITINKLFLQLHESIVGTPSDNHSLLEVGYCIGLPLGIIVFYNHFGKKKITADPTPIEVEMRLYENDINTTLTSGVNRKDCNIDVDN